MAIKTKRPTDWRKRFDKAKPPKTVVLATDFAGIKAGATLFIGSPGVIANYVSRIPCGETRTIVRLRNELARQNHADATCPVTTAIFLKIVAEVALDDLDAGAPEAAVVPFWRVIEPNTPLARRLSRGTERIAALRAAEAQAATTVAGPSGDAEASQGENAP